MRTRRQPLRRSRWCAWAALPGRNFRVGLISLLWHSVRIGLSDSFDLLHWFIPPACHPQRNRPPFMLCSTYHAIWQVLPSESPLRQLRLLRRHSPREIWLALRDMQLRYLQQLLPIRLGARPQSVNFARFYVNFTTQLAILIPTGCTPPSRGR